MTTSKLSPLLNPCTAGELRLKNRVVMAPLTRMRSKQPGNIPWELNATYYEQRASAGLIVSEATQVSPTGQGYPMTPGIHTREQRDGWRLVTDAVHRVGGLMVLQLWHVGRTSHSSMQPQQALPVAPSPIAPSGKAFTATGQQVPFEVPRELRTDELAQVVADFRQGARYAKDAGFDGVEVHGANGYLLDQFLQTGSNKRSDRYGGSIENRARLLLEVVDAAIEVWGPGRVGVRLSPYGTFNDMADEDPIALFQFVIAALSSRGIAYLHLIEPRSSASGASDKSVEGAPHTAELFRPYFKGCLISAGGYTPEDAAQTVSAKRADAVAFGRLFISNPDLPTRIEAGAPLNPYDRATFYGGSAKGYTDYPFFLDTGTTINQ